MRRTVMQLVEEASATIENISVAQLANEIEAGETTVVDVREQDEWVQGHIPGANHIPRGWLEFKADPSFSLYDARLRPDARIVTQCRIGHRGALSAAALKKLGYRNVANPDGGIKAWRAAGRPIQHR